MLLTSLSTNVKARCYPSIYCECNMHKQLSVERFKALKNETLSTDKTKDLTVFDGALL